MRVPSNEVTVNGHTMPGGKAIVDVPSLIKYSVVISGSENPKRVVFLGHGLTVELSGSAAERFLSQNDELPEPGPGQHTGIRDTVVLIEELLRRDTPYGYRPPLPAKIYPDMDELIEKQAAERDVAHAAERENALQDPASAAD